jgi:hemerythrin-like domain-containing protein
MRRNVEERLMSRPKSHPDRPRRSPTAGSATMEVLDRTHREILAMLAQVQLLIEKLEARGIDDGTRRLAHDVCAFFDETARPHHAAEEELVFPDLLATGDAELVQNVKRLQQDHGWLEEDWLELAPQLRAVANGQSWYDIDLLRSCVPTFTELYRDHIALEEDVVYPASRRFRAATSLPGRMSGN